MKILKYSVTAVIGQYLCRSYPLLCKEKALIFFFIFYKNSSNCYYFYVRTVHFYCLLFIICTNKYTHVYMYIYIYIYIYKHITLYDKRSTNKNVQHLSEYKAKVMKNKHCHMVQQNVQNQTIIGQIYPHKRCACNKI